MQDRFRRAVGYSLLEMLIAMSMMAILTGIFLVDSGRLFSHIRLKDFEHNLVHTLNRARVLAIQTGEPVSVCLTDATEHCDKGPAKDYIVFQRDDNNQKRIIQHNKLDLPISLQWQSFSVGEGVVFTPDGLCHKNGRLFLISDTTKKALDDSIVINLMGRVRIDCKQPNFKLNFEPSV